MIGNGVSQNIQQLQQQQVRKVIKEKVIAAVRTIANGKVKSALPYHRPLVRYTATSSGM